MDATEMGNRGRVSGCTAGEASSRHPRLRTGALLPLLVGALLSSQKAVAVTRSWVGGTGWWSTATNWSPIGQPQDGDTAFLTQSDATNRTISYANPLTPNPVLNLLRIDATGAGTITLSQTKDSLAAFDEYVGDTGNGAFLQSGGTNAITNYLYIAPSVGSSGSYELSNSGILRAAEESIGRSGVGALTQSGGANVVTDAIVMGDAGSGTYSLIGGSLSSTNQFLGDGAGTGVFNHIGGTNTLGGTLFLAQSNANGTATYNISGNAQLSVVNEVVGGAGSGHFNQTGGDNVVTDGIVLASQGVASWAGGTYDLSGGGVSANYETVGLRGKGWFTQSGGTNHVAAGLFLGAEGNGGGNYNLSGSGALFANSETIGGLALPITHKSSKSHHPCR